MKQKYGRENEKIKTNVVWVQIKWKLQVVDE